MGQVYVIRKGLQQILSPRGMELQYDFTANNQGGPPAIGGQGVMGALTQTPADASGNTQYQAPTIDDKGTQRMGDIYGAAGMNQRMDLHEKVRDAAPDSEEGFRNAMAQQKVFEQSGKAGQQAHRNREVLGQMAGGLGALVSLANAGASGQDAFTGGMGALGAYQSTAGQIGATSRGAGEAAAKRAARKVAVAQPTPQVASPTPVTVAPPTNTPDEKQLTTYTGRSEVMSTDRHGNKVPLTSEAARRGAEHRLNQQMGRDTSVNTNYSPVDHMGMPTAVGVEETGMVTGGGAQSTFPTGSQAGDEVAQAAANKVKVSPATTNTQPEQTDPNISGDAIGAETGQKKLVGVDNTAQEIKNATTQPAEGSDPANPAAEAQSNKKQSSTDTSMVTQSFNPMRFIGVV